MKRKVLSWLLAFAATTGTFALGIYVQTKIGATSTPLMYSLAILVMFLLWNNFSYIRIKQDNEVSYRKYVDAFENQRKFVNYNFKAFVRSYENQVNKVWLWMYGCLIATGFLSFSIGLNFTNAGTVGVLSFVVLYLFWGLFAWLIRIPSEEVDKSIILDKEKYSGLYKVLYEVFSNEKKKPILVYGDRYSLSSLTINNRVVIGTGALALSVLDEEEFKQFLLFEKGYIENKRKGASGRANEIIFNHRGEGGSNTLTYFVEKFYMERIRALSEYADFANKVAETYYEKLAYIYVKENGDIKHLLSGSIKLRMLSIYHNFDEQLTVNFYADQKPVEDWFSQRAKAFYNSFLQKKEFWMEIVKKEIPRFGDLNLSFSEVLGIFDNPDFDVELINIFDEKSNTNDLFTADIKTLCAECDSEVYAAVKDSYNSDREIAYEKKIRLVDDYLKGVKNNKEYSSADVRAVMDACYDTKQIDFLKKLCKETIEKYGRTSYASHAFYLLGKVLLLSYDKAGIPNMYEAIELNNNYVKDGFDYIENFCAVMGLSGALDNCNNVRIIKLQKMSDENAYAIRELKQGDKLSEETLLSKEEQQANLEEIKRICGDDIEELYQIHKEVSKEVFTTSYVIKFKKEVSKETANEYYGKIFRYLDSLEWQYSLFDRSEVYIADLPGRII